MNRERDFDQTLKHWLDDGTEHAPERFVWAALERVERTTQRGAWRASLEGLVMKLKIAAPYIGIGAVIVVALIVAGQLFIGGRDAGRPTPDPSPRVSASPRTLIAEDLATIVPPHDGELRAPIMGDRALAYLTCGTFAGTAPRIPRLGFVTAMVTDHYGDLHGQSDQRDYYMTEAALFEAALDASRVFDYVDAELISADTCELKRSAATPGLGDESAFYTGTIAGGNDRVGIYLWRVNNVVLEVGGGPFLPATLLAIAETMDASAR
jgi:hypothetical protein